MATATNHAKTHPYNLQLFWSLLTTQDVTTTNFTQLGDIKSLKIGGVEFGETNITHLASANAFQESMAGWGKQKPISFNLFFHDENFEALLESTQVGYGRGTATFAVVGPDPTQPTTRGWVYYNKGWIKDMDIPEVDADSDDPIMCNVEVQPTGRGTFSTATT